MNERTQDQIDRYLRREMSAEESLLFEQEALNNPELQREVEISYLVKRSLSDRQRKLFQTAMWKSKRRNAIYKISAITSIAAAIMCGVFILWPNNDANMPSELIANEVLQDTEVEVRTELALREVRVSAQEGKNREAVKAVEELEAEQIIPSINEISRNQFMMSNTSDNDISTTLHDNIYELHWLKIRSLVNLGDNENAIESLKVFHKLSGKHQQQADSLLSELNQNNNN